jgi:hypothetical protein
MVMKKRLVLTGVLGCCAWMSAQEVPNLRDVPKIHQFRLWNTLNQVSKLDFLAGFTNGFLAGAAVKQCAADKATKALLECVGVNKDPSYDQAIAMIDKYYKDNPEKWNIPIGDAIVEALTVKGGPCVGTDPQR